MNQTQSYQAFLKVETGTHTTRINQLLVTPDGKTLISAGEKTIRVWDVQTKRLERMLLGQIGIGGEGTIQRIALSPDGNYVLALARVTSDRAQGDRAHQTDLRVMELATGNLQACFQHPGFIQDLDFSPRGDYLALVGSADSTTRQSCVQIYATKPLLDGSLAPARRFCPIPPPLASEPLDHNPADSLLPAFVRFVPENLESSQEIRLVIATQTPDTDQPGGFTGQLLWYAFTPPAALTRSPAPCEISEHTPPTGLAVSREFVVVTGETKKIFCYDHAGKPVNTLLYESIPAAPAFSANGKRLIVGQGIDSPIVQVSVYDATVEQFTLVSTYHGHDAEVGAVAMLRDGTAVSAGGDQNAIHFWSPLHFEGEQTGIIKGVGRVVHAVGIDPDERIGIGNYDDLRQEDGRILLQRVFNLKDMTLRPLAVTEAQTFRRAETRAGEKWLEARMGEGEDTLFLRPGDERVTAVSSPQGAGLTTFGFTEKGSIVTGARDGQVRIARLDAWGCYAPSGPLLVGHTAPLRDHAACGRWLVTAGADQIIRLWFLDDVEHDSSETLEPALNLFVGTDDEWVIWSKSGYYNASARGDRRFGYHVNRGANQEALYFPSDRFIAAFFRPDVIQAIIEFGSQERAFAALEKQDRALSPVNIAEILPPIVELAENGVAAGKDRVKLTFTVENLNPKQPIRRVWIVQNDRFAWQSKTIKRQYTVTLPLLPGRNRLKILAETDRAKAMPVIQTLTGASPRRAAAARAAKSTGAAARQKDLRRGVNFVLGSGKDNVPDNGVLFLLAVGVSHLETPRPDKNFNNLQFADADAIAIYNAFAKADLSGPPVKKAPLRNKAFRSVQATILLNEQATKANILAAVNKISAKIRARSAGRGAQRDVFFVFLSGHGVRRTDEKTHEQDLYFWNYDLDFDNTRRTGLSLIDLGRQITSVPAEVILATDACHSGMAGSDVVKGLDPNELAKRIYAINERGLYVLNAARSQELALESARADIRHGIFTKSILETLQVDRNVNMLTLIASVQQRVQYYTNREQTPICRMYGDLLPLVVYEK